MKKYGADRISEENQIDEENSGFTGVILKPLDSEEKIIIPCLIEEILKECFSSGEEVSGLDIKARFAVIMKNCPDDLRNPEFHCGERVFKFSDGLLSDAIKRIINYELEHIKDNTLYGVGGFAKVDVWKIYGSG